jgi:hypothetical protein
MARPIGGYEQEKWPFDSAALPLWVEIWVENRRCPESVEAGAAYCRSVILMMAIGRFYSNPLSFWVGGGGRRVQVLSFGQGEAQIAEPGPGDPDPFPPVRGLSSCRDMGQSCVQSG